MLIVVFDNKNYNKIIFVSAEVAYQILVYNSSQHFPIEQSKIHLKVL